MTKKKMPDDNPHRLAVEGEMTIYTAAEWKDKLVAPLTRCPQVEADLSAVTEIDSAGLQLLIMAKREAAARGKTLHFVNHSPAVLAVLDFCDLGGFFGDPVLIPSQANA